MDDSTQPTMEPVNPQVQPSQPVSPASGGGWVQPVPDSAMVSLVPMPGSVVVAAVVLLVLGVIALLVAGLFLLSGSIYQQLPNSTFNGLDPAEIDSVRSFGRVFAFAFGAVALIVAICHLAAGVGIFRRGTWARVLGMVMAGLGLIFSGLFFVLMLSVLIGGLPVASVGSSGMTPEEVESAMRAGIGVFVVIVGACLAAYLFTLVALIRNGRVFR